MTKNIISNKIIAIDSHHDKINLELKLLISLIVETKIKRYPSIIYLM